MSHAWTVRLPWPAPPLSANDRDHWRVKAKKVADARQTARTLIALAYVATADTTPTWPLDRAHITLTYIPRDRRRRDRMNLAPLLKALVDGAVDAGVVVDDDDAHVTEAIRIAEPDGDPRLVLTITEVP